MITKIYVDGFRIDDIETPKPEDDLESLIMTAKVKEFLENKEDKGEVTRIISVPEINPKLVIIDTNTILETEF